MRAVASAGPDPRPADVEKASRGWLEVQGFKGLGFRV